MTHVDDATFALLLNSTRLQCWFCHVKGHDVKGHNVKGHNVKGHDVNGHAGVERTIVLLAGEFMRWRWEGGGVQLLECFGRVAMRATFCKGHAI